MYLIALGTSRAHSLYSLSQKQTIPSATQMHGICPTKTIQGGTGAPAEDGIQSPPRGK